MTNQLFTPRKIAWLVLLSLVAWFVVASPKTPQQFFAAANGEHERDKQRLIAEFDKIDPVRSVDAQKLLQLHTLSDEMRSMELDFDCQRNAAHVKANRKGVLLGAYASTPDSIETLTRNNDQYRSLLAAFNQLRADIKADKKYSTAFRELQRQLNSTSTKRAKILPFVRMMQAMFWRNFQAMIFWPDFNNKDNS